MRDHKELKVTTYRGLFDCGEDVAVPPQYLRDCLNLEFLKRGVKTRFGVTKSIDISNIRRVQIYRISGQSQRLLILNNSGALYDSTSLNAPILVISSMTDFSSATLFNRAYITPHNGENGLPGESIYVYDGAGQARKAAGVAPTGFSLVATNSALSGKVEPGIHLIGVCYETKSGFLTRPGAFVSFTTSDSKKLDISNIMPGPAGTTARVLVSTKTIPIFNGDFRNRGYFAVPGGRVANNSDTTLTVDFYDADLQHDLTYLLEQLEEIPAGVCVNATARGRMMIGGEDKFPSTVRVSELGEPESFNGVEGFFNVHPGDAGSGVKNLFEHRAVIFASKSQRTYATTDQGTRAAFWRVIGVDDSIGANTHSVARILDYGQSIRDLVITADRSGVRLFNGTYALEALTKNIDDYWKRINARYFNNVEVIVDPVNFKIYALIPLDEAEYPSHVLLGDFREGLTADTIKWSPWKFPFDPVSGVVDVDVDDKPYFRVAGYASDVYSMRGNLRDDENNAIETIVQFTYLPHEESGSKDGTYHFAGVRLRTRGFGDIQLTATGLDDKPFIDGGIIEITEQPGHEFFRLLNLSTERCSVRLRMSNSREWMILTKMTLLSKFLWSEPPS